MKNPNFLTFLVIQKLLRIFILKRSVMIRDSLIQLVNQPFMAIEITCNRKLKKILK